MTETVPLETDESAVLAALPPKASGFVVIAALCFSGMSVALMQTLVIPIQTQLPGYLHTTAANASWVVTATLLGAAVAMPIAGRLGDLFGKQRVLVGSAVLMLVGSLVCALSSSLAPVLAGRTLQGLAMGFIPVGISLIREAVPAEMAATGIAAMSATLGVGGAIGLPLAAWIAGSHDWHALFWVATGMAALVLLASWFLLPHIHDGHSGTFDFGGAIGLAIGLVSVLVGVSKGNDWGWSSTETIGALVFGVVVLLAWGRYELSQREPLCDLRVSARRPVLLTNVAAVAVGFGMMAQAIVFPQLLQIPEETGYGMGQSVLHAGLWMAPGGLMMLFFAPVSSRLIRTFGAKFALAIGATVLGCGYLVSFFLISAPWEILIASSVCSAGVGIGYAAMPTLILDAVPMQEAGSAVGINGLMRSVGTTVAAAVMAALLTAQLSSFGLPTEGAFKLCFVVAAAAAFLGAALALTIPVGEKQPV